MSNDRTAIEWCDATWNPTTGCTRVSDGCRNCYAEALSRRFGHTQKPWTKPYEAENVKVHPERLSIPPRWRAPRRIFVDSMSDLFHELVPSAFVDSVWTVMEQCPRHTFQILTKRPDRMRAYVADRGWGGWRPVLPNVWLGTSVEDRRVVHRIDDLIATPAAVRFLSIEPMLGPVDLRPWLFEEAGPAWAGENPSPALDWVIVGGESGPHHRPFDPDWARTIRDDCRAAGVAFFFKQHGGRTPKAGGRLLDGRTWDEFPATAAVAAGG